MISYELTDDEQAVADAARQVAASADPWAGLVEGGWLDLLLDEPENGMRYVGLVAEELGYAGVATHLAGSAVVWPTVFGESAGGRRVGVQMDQTVEDGVGAELLVARTGLPVFGYDDFEVEALGALEGDGLARIVRRGEPIARCTDVTIMPLGGLYATCVVSCEMAGLIRRVFDMTLEHLRTREQFGRPLAQFQVIQHDAARLATMAEAATWAGRLAVLQPHGEHAHACNGWLSAAAHKVSALAHQLHGAIGFTEEYGLQRYTKRLRTLRFAWGDDSYHFQALGRRRALNLPADTL